MRDDSSVRIEISIRSALIAKSVLEMMSLEPAIAQLQLREVLKQIEELSIFLARSVAAAKAVTS